MRRIPSDRCRRLDLADAASFPTRTSVVLYVCVPPGQSPAAALRLVHGYAEARDWVVVAEIVDDTDRTVPVTDRNMWPVAQEYITSRRAAGVVTLERSMVGVDSEEQARIIDWLTSQNAFLAMATTQCVAGEEYDA